MEVTRATLAFDKTEDRISLTCAFKDHNNIILWLTARLARQLVPHLVELTAQLPEKDSASSQDEVVAERGSDTSDSFSGEATEGEAGEIQKSRAPESPVIAEAGSPSRVVTAIDITNSPMLVKLGFRDEQGDTAVLLSLEHMQLAQWLEGVQRCFIQAGWPMDCWQDPVGTGSSGTATQRVAVH